MADPPRPTDTGDSSAGEPDHGSAPSAPPGMPRWVKVSAAVAAALILLVLVVKLAGIGGEHGPGQHTGASGSPPAANTETWVPPGGDPSGPPAREGSGR